MDVSELLDSLNDKQRDVVAAPKTKYAYFGWRR